MRIFITTVVMLAAKTFVFGQRSVDLAFKRSTLISLENIFKENYIFPDVSEKIAAHFEELWVKKYFDTVTSASSLAQVLTNELQMFNDKHLMVFANQLEITDSVENSLEGYITYYRNARFGSKGFMEAKKLQENVGFVSLWCFDGDAYKFVDGFMQLLSTSDALLIDLRGNNGGDPHLITYFLSYFFKKPTQLSSIYWKFSDETEEYWTLDSVNGIKQPDIPIYILTSDRTFSGGEFFCYEMQAQKRATLVGDTTRGGANPGGMFRINEKLEVFISTGRSINPITKSNWEGVGVIPDIVTAKDSTYKKALAMAKASAEEYRQKKMTFNTALIQELKTMLYSIGEKPSNDQEEKLRRSLKKCVDTGFLTEQNINDIGYNYLSSKQMVKAKLIFETNMLLFPNSAEAIDSYADALLHAGNKNGAITFYKKALRLAEKTKRPNLRDYKAHLKSAMSFKL